MNEEDGPFYVRLSRRGDWDSISESTLEDVTFPADVLADVLDLEGETSIWQIETLGAENIGMIAAALHAVNATNLSDMNFRVISELLLKRLGLVKRQTKGGSLDNILNSAGRHWVVATPTVHTAIVLAKAFARRPAIVLSRREVLTHFAKSIQEKRISTKSVSSDLWKRLFDEGFLRCIAPANCTQ